MADGEPLTVRYSSPFRLFADLRGMAMTNMLRDRHAPPYSRGRLEALLAAMAGQADADGKLPESFALLFLTCWAPSPEQPKPARRGSGTRSLADVFRPFTQKDSG